MTARSRYDELHDRYHAILTTKGGTRYERLGALVFKILEDRNVVIHNLKLVGDSAVPHQIDVSIEVGGKRRRVIVECKDFDLSRQKVGLDILRNFRSVIEDTKADEGIVLTCNGLARPNDRRSLSMRTGRGLSSSAFLFMSTRNSKTRAYEGGGGRPMLLSVGCWD